MVIVEGDFNRPSVIAVCIEFVPMENVLNEVARAKASCCFFALKGIPSSFEAAFIYKFN